MAWPFTIQAMQQTTDTLNAKISKSEASNDETTAALERSEQERKVARTFAKRILTPPPQNLEDMLADARQQHATLLREASEASEAKAAQGRQLR